MGEPELGLGLFSGRAVRTMGKIAVHGNRAKNREKKRREGNSCSVL